MNKLFTVLMLTALLLQLTTSLTYTERLVVEIEAYASLTRVIDGDTIEVLLLNVSSKFKGKVHAGQKVSVRLADIDTPELYVDGSRNEPGWRSREALVNLLKGVNVIYLNIDDIEVYDWYNRLIAVVYITHNSTHLLNVNKWLVDNGYARVRDFRNATDPATWVLYVNTADAVTVGFVEDKSGGGGFFRDKIYLELTVIYAAIAFATILAYVYVWRTLSVKK